MSEFYRHLTSSLAGVLVVASSQGFADSVMDAYERAGKEVGLLVVHSASPSKLNVAIEQIIKTHQPMDIVMLSAAAEPATLQLVRQVSISICL